MNFFKLIFFGSFVLLTTVCSCRFGDDGESKGAASERSGQNVLKGNMNVVVDESVFALMAEQVNVFHSDYVGSRIQLVAEPERVAINTLLKGEAAVGVLTRELTAEESAGFKQRSITPRVFPIAYDGIVLMSRVGDQDSLISVSDIKAYLSGEAESSKKLVFDDVNSSTLRFLKELSGLERVLATQVQAESAVEDVFSAVMDEGHIGVVSLNQYLTYRDTLDIAENVRILAVKNEEDGQYYKPSQSTLADETYPLKQQVYVLNYQPNLGLGVGFSAFLTGDRGQRIVLKSGLLPAKMPGRELIIRDEFRD